MAGFSVLHRPAESAKVISRWYRCPRESVPAPWRAGVHGAVKDGVGLSSVRTGIKRLKLGCAWRPTQPECIEIYGRRSVVRTNSLRWQCLASMWLVLACASPACADEAAPLQTRPLRVATGALAPFVIKEGDRFAGFSVDLWSEIGRASCRERVL